MLKFTEFDSPPPGAGLKTVTAALPEELTSAAAINKLNDFHGNFVQAEMVKAFIVSAEYRSRFGP